MLTPEHAAALEALERGWSIIPINPTDKRPMVSWKEYQDRFPTDEEVDHWWTTWPHAIPAVITGWRSGVYIVDCDTPEAQIIAKQLGITSSVRVQTKHGVHHYFMRPDDGIRRGPRVGSLGSADAAFPWPKQPGLDWRGDGGYALLPTDGGNYRWDIDPHADVMEPPVWTRDHDRRLGARDGQAFDPDTPPTLLDLTNVRTLRPDSHLSAWEIAEREAKVFPGGKFPTGLGNGRNQRVVLHLSEAIRMGMWGDALEAQGRLFMTTFFEEPLHERDFKATLRWIMQAKRRDNPELFDAGGNLIARQVMSASLAPAINKPALPTAPTAPAQAPLPFVYMRDWRQMRAEVAARGDLISPFIPAGGCIIQVYGYTGHGKSTFVQHLMAAACSAGPHRQWWGPFEIKRVPKVLYLQFEEGKSTISSRLEGMEGLYGDTEENLATWYPAKTPDLSGSLRDDAFLAAVNDWVRRFRPDIVVIDTVRSAWSGLEETKAEAWAPVNTLAMKLRNVGIAVILLHHGNKPSETNSVGTEAGSTAQLNNIETQLRIVRVYASETEAKLGAGLHADKIDPADFGYAPGSNVLAILAADAGPDHMIEWAMEARYRKLREPTDEHDKAYMLGFARNLHDGSHKIVTSYSVKQRAQYYNSQGMPLIEIARRTLRPVSVLRGWLGLP